MSQQPTRGRVPDGVQDRLPKQTRILSDIVDSMRKESRLWGYAEIITPTFEFAETVTEGIGVAAADELYQFFDQIGRTLALRPDMTTPIARVVATKMAGEPRPLRLSYAASAFRRRTDRTGRPHEEFQVGVELLGDQGTAADAEVIALMCAMLSAAGVNGVRICVGHVRFVQGLLELAGLGQDASSEVKRALASGDLVMYRRVLGEQNIPDAMVPLLESIADFGVPWGDATRRYRHLENQQVQEALNELESLFGLLDAYGVGQQVALDLSLARDFDYYTGAVFEGYAPGVGVALCGGGRYDHLLSAYGTDMPATGFAMDLDRLLSVLLRQGKTESLPPLDYLLVPADGCSKKALAMARQLRTAGFSVEVDLFGRSQEATAEYARSRRVSHVVTVSFDTPHALRRPVKCPDAPLCGIH